MKTRLNHRCYFKSKSKNVSTGGKLQEKSSTLEKNEKELTQASKDKNAMMDKVVKDSQRLMSLQMELRR